MALHKDFPQSPHAILDPDIRWFPADEALRESSMEKLMPPLVAEPRRKATSPTTTRILWSSCRTSGLSLSKPKGREIWTCR